MLISKRLIRVKSLLWAYFWLLIFEGALRKWFLPSLSNYLLLVRDPIALLALYLGWPYLRIPKFQQWIRPLLITSIFVFFLAVLIGHGDIITALYGSRVLFLHFPLIFLYSSVFTRDDVIKFSWYLALCSIPMTILIVMQSNLPSTHFLNIAPGGEGSAVFDGALGRHRPPGTFSFINGLANYYTLVASSFFTILYESKSNFYSYPLSILFSISLLIAQPVSMSRSLLAGYIQVVLSVLCALALSRTKLLPILSIILAFTIAISIASSLPVFQETSLAFNKRWEDAAINESGGDSRLGGGVGVFQNRFLGGFSGPLSSLDHIPILGHGIGMATNFGAQRLSGSRVFILGEGSWETSLQEMGLLFGIIFITWRVIFASWLLHIAISQALGGNRIPLFWIGSSLLLIINGQQAQPTALGMITLSAGLTLAACNRVKR